MASYLTHKTSVFIPHTQRVGMFTVLFSVLVTFASYVSRAYNDRSSQICPLVLSLIFFSWSILTAFLSALVTTSFHNISFSKLILSHNDHSPVQQQILNEATQ